MTFPIPIPSGISYIHTASGSVLRLVCCESCHAEYAYQLKRTAEGDGTSYFFLNNRGAATRASRQAEASLRYKLEHGVDLVPCPECGWYQNNMRAKARRLHRRWMFTTGACLLIILIPVGSMAVGATFGDPRIPLTIPLLAFLCCLIALAVVAISLIAAKLISARQYDPNSEDATVRKQIGRSRAIWGQELAEIIKTLPAEYVRRAT